MRIAFLHYRFIPNPDYVDLVVKLRERGHEVWFGTRDENNLLSWHDGQEVIAKNPGQPPPPQFLKKLPLVPTFWTYLAYLFFIWRVTRFLRASGVDIAQIVQPSYLHQAFPAMMGQGTKSVLAIKQMNLGTKPDIRTKIRDWLEKISISFSSRYLYHHTVFDYYITAKAILGPHWQKWATAIPLGLNPGLLEVNAQLRDPQSSEPIRFIYVGKLSKFRKLEVLIEGAVLAADTNDRFVIDIIGPDRENGYYQALVEQLGAGQVVNIKDPVPYDTIPQLMATYDVGLAYTPDYLTWQYQPTIKILEYRAVGLPILATDLMANYDIVQEGVNGVLVHDNAKSVAVGLLKFITDHEYLANCYQHAQKNRQMITAMDVAQRHEDVYKKVLAADE